MKSKEWRVVSRTRFGTFKYFGENETEARKFMTGFTIETSKGPSFIKPGQLANDPLGTYALESRSVGGRPQDWVEEKTS